MKPPPTAPPPESAVFSEAETSKLSTGKASTGKTSAGKTSAGKTSAGKTSAVPQETVRIEVNSPLAEQGEEIGALVAQGQLEAAMKQLEDTMSRRSDDSALGLPPLPEEGLEEPLVEPRPVEPRPAEPRSAEPAARDTVPSVPPSINVRTGSYGTFAQPFRVWGKWLAVAVLALGVLGLGGWWLSRDEPQEVSQAIMPPPPPTPPPPVTIERPKGGAVIHASPWAEVTEITRQDGYVVELPLDPFTPLYLRLQPGAYRISLRHPDHPEELKICDLEVGLDLVATCEESFGLASATEYFKESGWWK